MLFHYFILTDSEKSAIKYCKENGIFTLKEIVLLDTLFCTGMRPGEVLALTQSDVDYRNRQISVSKALTWKGGKTLKAPKSNSGFRTIDVPSWYINEIKEYSQSLNSLYLFSGANGDLISQTTYKTLWHNIYQKINIQLGGTKDSYYSGKMQHQGIHATDLTPYVFRHNYATMLYYAGVDLKEAQRLLGHSSIKITLEVYTHLASEKNSLKEKISTFAI